MDVVRTLLASLGSPKEVELYLRNYVSEEKIVPVIVRVAGAVLDEECDSLAAAIALLAKIGIDPIVVFGARPQIDRALLAQGIQSETRGGRRITPAPVLEVVRKTLLREGQRLADAIEAAGAKARPFGGGVLWGRRTADERMGFVGDIDEVDDEPIVSSLHASAIPVIAPLLETDEGQILNVTADDAAIAIAHALRPKKILLLTQSGGLKGADGAVLPAVNLAEDFTRLVEDERVPESTRRALVVERRVLEALPPITSISITRPDSVVKELFTHRGKGTLVRLGESVRVFSSFSDVDRERMKHLIEGSFGRRLDERYFDVKKPHRIYLADSYRACAIVTYEPGVGPHGAPYLDKFAVTPEAQGAGVGGSIWNRLVADEPRFFWRARRTNPINRWYFDVAEGAQKRGDWAVFWVGGFSHDEIEDLVEIALAYPPTMHGTSP
jgi:acetylglutamate kinase